MNMAEDEKKKEASESFKATQDDSAESEEIVEFEFNEDGEEDFKKTLKKLRVDLKACQAEKTEYLNGWQKERADFINYKKQEEDRKANFSEAVRERILARFLTVLDSFNVAFTDKEAWDKVEENWRKGMEHIYVQLNTVFEEYDVKPIGEVGESFDPNIHQSVNVVPTDKKENDHKVAEVIQKGYKLGERVLRPARINVYEYKEPS